MLVKKILILLFFKNLKAVQILFAAVFTSMLPYTDSPETQNIEGGGIFGIELDGFLQK